MTKYIKQISTQEDKLYNTKNHPLCSESNRWNVLSTNCIINDEFFL